MDAAALVGTEIVAVEGLNEVDGKYTIGFNSHFHLSNLLEDAELEAYLAAYEAATAEDATAADIAAYEALVATHVTFAVSFANLETIEIAVLTFNDFKAELVGQDVPLTFNAVPVIPEENTKVLVSDLSALTWQAGKTVNFDDIKFYLVELNPQGGFVGSTVLDRDEVHIFDNNCNIKDFKAGDCEEVNEYTLPTVFHDNMDGKVFTAVHVIPGATQEEDKVYTDVFTTGVNLPVRATVSFDSLNVSINYGLEATSFANGEDEHVVVDQDYINNVTSYSEESIVETEVSNGKVYSEMKQEVVFKKPGVYNIPVLHVSETQTEKVGYVEVIVTAETNEKLGVAYEGVGSKFNFDSLKVTAAIAGTETHGIALDNEHLFIYDDNFNAVDENYVMAPGTQTVFHVTYNESNTNARLLNHTVYYGSAVVAVDAEGTIVVPDVTTPSTGLASNANYYVGMAALGALALVLVKRSKKENI